MTEKPHYIEELTKEVTALKDCVGNLCEGQKTLVGEVQKIKEKISYVSWLTDASEGFLKIPKTLWLAIILIAMFILFGVKAIALVILNFLGIKL